MNTPTDQGAREARYAEAIRPHTSESHERAERPTGCWCKASLPDGEWSAHLARSVMAVADAEQAELRAERDGLRDALSVVEDTLRALREGIRALADAADSTSHLNGDSYGAVVGTDDLRALLAPSEEADS